MLSNEYLFRSESLEIYQVVPCAEDPHLLQVSGHAYDCPNDELSHVLEMEGWRAMRIGVRGSIVAKRPTGDMLIVEPAGGFTLSRIANIDDGCALLKRIFLKSDQSHSEQKN